MFVVQGLVSYSVSAYTYLGSFLLDKFVTNVQLQEKGLIVEIIMENKSSESDEEEQPNLSSSSAATHHQINRGISLGRDYDIIEDEAVLSSSPSYQSIPRTGQVIPIEESRSHNVTESKDSNSAGGSATTGSRKDTHGCNPFANLPRTITATSSDGNAVIQQQNETDDDALYCIDDGPPSDDRIQIKKGNADRASQQQQKEVERYEAEPLTNLSALPRVNCPEKIVSIAGYVQFHIFIFFVKIISSGIKVKSKVKVDFIIQLSIDFKTNIQCTTDL